MHFTGTLPFAALPVTAALMLSACGTGPDSAGIASGPVRAVVQTVTPMDVPQTYVFSGNVEGDKRVTLSTKIMGQVIALRVREGDRVRQGQELLKIKSDDLDAKKAQVKAGAIEAGAALKNVETNYRRIEELYALKSATQKEMDDIELAYRMALARVEAVREMEKEIDDALSYSDILSPVSGFVVQKMTEIGNTAAPGIPLLVIEDLTTLKVVIHVPETEIRLFSRGDNVEVSIDATGTETGGTVDRINPSGQAGSRQFEVHVLLDRLSTDERDRVRSGMFARVVLEQGSRQVVAVPEQLIVKRGQLEGLFTLSHNNQAHLRWVRTGRRFGAQVEILSGLAAGDRLIASTEGTLKDGMPIEVKP
jgi:RND family efflux transporter MFP subunit